MKRKKIIIDDDIDFDALEASSEEEGAASLDAIFQHYHTPIPPDDDEAPEDETFLQAAEEEAAQMLAEFERADKEQLVSLLDKNKAVVNSGADTDYFVCVVFVSEAQKLAFLEASGWDRYGGARYLNGIEMAQDMGIELPPAYLAMTANPDKAMTSLRKGGQKQHGKS